MKRIYFCVILCFVSLLFSRVSSAITLTPSIPTPSLTGLIFNSTVTLEWSAVNGLSCNLIDVYEVEESLDGISWSRVYYGRGNSSGNGALSKINRFVVKSGAMAASSFGDDCLMTNVINENLGRYITLSNHTQAQYFYRIRACDGLCGAYSSVLTLGTPPPGTIGWITLSSPNNTTGAFYINWAVSSSATKYIIEEQKNGGSWVRLTSSWTSTKYTFSSKSDGEYKYRIQACNGSVCGPWKYSSETTVLKIPDSASITVSATPSQSTEGNVNVSWNSVTTASYYKLYIKKDSGALISNTGNLTTLSYKFSSLDDGAYIFAIAACNGSGCSSLRYSNSVLVKRPPVVPQINTPIGVDIDGRYTISWKAISSDPSSGDYNASSSCGSADSCTIYVLQELKVGGSWSTIQSNTISERFPAPINGLGFYEYLISGKSTGSYAYRVKACEGTLCGDWATSNKVDVLLPPPVPSSISVPSTTVKNGSIAISWSAASTATSYTLQESVNNGSWTTITSPIITSYTRTGRGSGSYKYRVRACNASGCSGWRASGSVTVLLPPPVPGSLSVPTSTVTNGSIGISWAASSTATSYTLQESVNNGAWVTITSPTTTSYTRTGRPNGSYKYQVRACNASGCSGWRASGSVTVLLPPPVPTAITVPTTTDTDGAYSIGWSTTSTATSYTLAERINSGSWVYTTESGTSKAYSGRGNGSYEYAVRGCNSSGCGGWRYSSAFSVLLPPPVPTTITVPTVTDTDGTYSVSWSATSTATSYTLAERINGGSWVYTTESGTSKAYSGRGNGSYEYAVRGCNSSGCGGWRYSSALSVLLPPSVPASISVPTSTVINGSIAISWAASSKATSYTIQESVSKGPWVTLSSPTTTSYTRTGRGNGSYKYQVRACNASGCSGWRVSSEVSVLLPPPVPGSISVPSATVKNGSIAISWSAASTATSYTLQESVNSGAWTTITSPTTTSYTRTGRGNGFYKYQVRACNASGCSGWRASSAVSVLLPPPVPGSISVPSTTVINGSITISWSAASTATSYILQESVNSGAWTTITSPTTTSYTRTGRGNGSYKYQVRACNASGCSGWRASSAVSVLLPPPVPGSISVPSTMVKNGSIAISWSAASTATSYTLQESVNSGAWATITSPTTTSYTRAGRGNGSYKYQVRACNASGCSGWQASSTVSVLLAPPVPSSISVPSTTVTNGSIAISWSAASTATSYTLQESVDNGAWTTVTSLASTGYAHDVNSSGSYKYRVRACNASGCGGWKESIAVTVSLAPEWRRVKSVTVKDADEVGSLPSTAVDLSAAFVSGQAAVEGGQASYRVKIELPPGRNGIEPKVSLSYNSQNGNGIVGVGWSLNAGSVISRCGATYAQDGFKGTVKFDVNDRLCLDGQRLIAFGDYGKNATVYRTEMDSFVKVVQSGDLNGISTSFTVYRPNGSIATYGANENSRFIPSGLDKTLTWKLTQESWAGGYNTIDYDYNSSLAGEHLLSKIHYTGSNDIKGGRFVEFIYDASDDERISYLSGGGIKRTKKLSRVNTYLNDSNQVSSYKLSYSRLSASKRNLLSSIKRCGFANGVEQCGLATTFDWHLTSKEVAQEKLNYSAIFSDVKLIKDIMPKGDVDGNGVIDFPEVLLNAEGEKIGVHSKYYDDCQLNQYIGVNTCVAFDADMDGITDSHRIVNGKLNISLSNGGDYNTNIYLGSGNKYNQDSVVYAGDLNGNGYPDLVLYHYDSGKPKLYRYFHSGNVSSPYSNNGVEIYSFALINDGQSDWTKSIYRNANFIGDIDGNGFADLLITNTVVPGFGGGLVSIPGGYPEGFLLGQGDGSFNYKKFEGGEIPTVKNANIFNMFIDVNGDGLSDWLGWKSTENVYDATPNLYVRLNNGLAEFGLPKNLGNDLIGLRSYVAMIDPYGEEIRYRVPYFNGAIKVSDINTNGVAELLIPSQRIVEGCSKVIEVDKRNKTFKEVDKCGGALYGEYYPSYTFTPEERPQPTQLISAETKDDSIYQFDAIEFSVSEGVVTASRLSTNFIGSATQSSVLDIFGDGLQDMLFIYSPRVGNWIKSGQSLPSWINGYGTYLSRSQSSSEEPYQANDYLASVTDGIGNITRWSYRPLSTGLKSDGEQKLYEVVHSYIDGEYVNFTSSMYVVQSFDKSDGQGASNETQYAYKGAMYNLHGRGFTGFREILEKDVARNKVTRSVFKQKFPEVGLLESQTVEVDGITVATIEQTWADNPQHNISGVYHNINTSSVSHSYGLSGTSELRGSVEQTVELANVDQYGNISKTTKIVTDYIDDGANRYQTEVSTEFKPDVDNWFLRKFDSKKTTSSVVERGWLNDPFTGKDTEQWQIVTVNQWDTVHRQPVNITYTASGSSCNRVEATALNDYGLPIQVSVTGTSSDCSTLAVRTTDFTYTNNGSSQSEDGYLPYTVTNAKNHVTTTEYDMGLGVPTKVTAPNSIVTETKYDSIGRPVQIAQTGRPTKYVRYSLASNGSYAPAHAQLLTRTIAAGMPTQEIYLDSLGRNLRSATQAFDGNSYQFVDKRYDSLGRLTHESLPYYNDDIPQYTIFSGFDAFDRPAKRSLPNGYSGGLISTYSYTGLQTDITVEGRTMSRTYGMNGLLYETVDAASGSNRFAYDGESRPLIIQDANGKKIVAQYNGFGHKTQVEDPNQGKTIFGYNTLGELESQSDANNVTQHFTLDTLGRITQKTIAGNNVSGSASFVWDTLKKGMLSSESQNGVTRSYAYTETLQLASSSVKVAESAGGDNITRTVSHQYDSFYGRPKALTYPNGITLEYRYNDYGYLEQTLNAASGYVYRSVTGMDAAGHVTGSQMANSLLTQVSSYNVEGTMASTEVTSALGLLHGHYYDLYDRFMNLVDERNGVTGLAKHYEYDNLNRLEQYSFSNSGFAINSSTTPFAASVDYQYDAVGNILKKSDYSVNTTNAYEYQSSCLSGSNAGPNAVCAITKLNGSKVQFRYDKRGNLLSGDGLTMTYNELDKPLTILGRGSDSNTSTTFVYASDNKRALQTRVVSGITTKTHYVDKLYEVDNDGSWRAYISDVAVLSYTPERSYQLLYTLRDRLGSATTMVDQNGNIITQRYFDPFGRTASTSAAGSLGDLLDTNRNRRGFTDHEHLNEQQLIHMNGRVYDYNLGRFLSVDPLIQSPTSTQSVNPYSYIMNNPLSGTDPTGYCTAQTGSRICKSEVKATVTKQGSTASVHLTGGTVKQQLAVANAIVNGASNTHSAAVAGVADVGSIKENAKKEIAGTSKGDVKDTADNTAKVMTGASTVTAGLEQTKDLALLNTKGTGTALMATGSTGNAWSLAKNPKSNLLATSLDGSKLASKLSPQFTVVGLAASIGSNYLNEDATQKEAAVKSGFDVGVALVGLRGGVYGAVLSIGYSVVDVTYPGGWIQLNRDVNSGISNFSREIDTHHIQEGWREDPMNTMRQVFGIPVVSL